MASTPPTVALAPMLLSSFATWMLNTVPAARAVMITIRKLPGPASCSWSSRSMVLIRPLAVAVTAWPPMIRLLPSRFSQRGDFN